MSLTLSTVMIGSENSDRLGEFYTKFLGEPGWKGSDGWYGYKVGGFLVVGPHSEVKGSNTVPGRLMFSFETDDVAAEFEKIKGLGATVIKEPYHPGESQDMWLATLADPDGNYFQLASPMKM